MCHPLRISGLISSERILGNPDNIHISVKLSRYISSCSNLCIDVANCNVLLKFGQHGRPHEARVGTTAQCCRKRLESCKVSIVGNTSGDASRSFSACAWRQKQAAACFSMFVNVCQFMLARQEYRITSNGPGVTWCPFRQAA